MSQQQLVAGVVDARVHLGLVESAAPADPAAALVKQLLPIRPIETDEAVA